MLKQIKYTAFLMTTTFVCLRATQGWIYMIRDAMDYFAERKHHN